MFSSMKPPRRPYSTNTVRALMRIPTIAALVNIDAEGRPMGQIPKLHDGKRHACSSVSSHFFGAFAVEHPVRAPIKGLYRIGSA